MATLRYLHQMMNERRMVRLSDGRVGKIVRVDTLFPSNATVVTIWTDSNESIGPNSNGPSSITGPASGPGISKVSLTDVVGEVDSQTQESA
jgi:hypothetical protein